MQEQKVVQQNPLLRIWDWGKDEHGRLVWNGWRNACVYSDLYVGILMGIYKVLIQKRIG